MEFLNWLVNVGMDSVLIPFLNNNGWTLSFIAAVIGFFFPGFRNRIRSAAFEVMKRGNVI